LHPSILDGSEQLGNFPMRLAKVGLVSSALNELSHGFMISINAFREKEVVNADITKGFLNFF
jgi:hypothetical protein